MIRSWTYGLVLLLSASQIHAQRIDFADGLYVDYEQYKSNQPVSTHNLIFPDDSDKTGYWTKFIEQDTMYYYDSIGVIHQVPIDSVFGFCSEGAPYVRTTTGFYKVLIPGVLTCYPKHVEMGLVDPFWGVNFSSESVHRIASQSIASTGIGYYVLDTRTGATYLLDYQSVAELIREDQELYRQYRSLRRKEQKKMQIFYVRRFNERNPL